MIKPLNNRTILKTVKGSNMTRSGIVLTEEMDKNQLIAEVESTSDSGFVQQGQKVLVYKHSCNKILYNNEEYNIVKNEDILAIVED